MTDLECIKELLTYLWPAALWVARSEVQSKRLKNDLDQAFLKLRNGQGGIRSRTPRGSIARLLFKFRKGKQ